VEGEVVGPWVGLDGAAEVMQSAQHLFGFSLARLNRFPPESSGVVEFVVVASVVEAFVVFVKTNSIQTQTLF